MYFCFSYTKMCIYSFIEMWFTRRIKWLQKKNLMQHMLFLWENSHADHRHAASVNLIVFPWRIDIYIYIEKQDNFFFHRERKWRSDHNDNQSGILYLLPNRTFHSRVNGKPRWEFHYRALRFMPRMLHPSFLLNRHSVQKLKIPSFFFNIKEKKKRDREREWEKYIRKNSQYYIVFDKISLFFMQKNQKIIDKIAVKFCI